ncbi:MAG: Gfo/Idh/MocA family oxidoreductase [Myxococcota bacterium]
MSTHRFFDDPNAARAFTQRFSGPSTPPNFRIAIVGAGMMGREHLAVSALLGRAHVVGVLEPHAPSFAEAERIHDGPTPLRRYENLNAVIEDGELDAIFLCTPNFTHAELFESALASGKALFVEKPMATRLVDAARMVELAQSHGNIVQLGMQYRFKSQYRELFHRVKHLDAVGPVKTMSVSEYRPAFLDKVSQWNKFNANTGGTLVEKCCHYFDLLNLMADARPVRVFATGGRAVNFLDFEYEGRRSDIDDHAFVLIDYVGGIRASFTLNMFSAELYEEMVVTGPKGRLVAREEASFHGRPSRASLIDDTDVERGARCDEITYAPTVERSGHHGATLFEHIAFFDALEGKATDAATPLEGLWSLIVASAAQESIARSQPVDIDRFVERALAANPLIKEGHL